MDCSSDVPSWSSPGSRLPTREPHLGEGSGTDLRAFGAGLKLWSDEVSLKSTFNFIGFTNMGSKKQIGTI